MSDNTEYDSLSNKEIVKLATEKMGIVKSLVREIRKSLSKIEGA